MSVLSNQTFPNQALLDQVVELTKAAGSAILSVYHRQEGFTVTAKEDDSPVTDADLAANACLLEGLSALTPEIPILSEEGGLPDFTVRSQWRRYWLVDPLDGTKEFISRNGEFTVNVALIEDGVPVLGVVHVPVTGVTYTGLLGTGLLGTGLLSKEAKRIDGDRVESLSVRSVKPQVDKGLPVVIVASRRYGAEAVVQLCQRIKARFGEMESHSVGSSLKLCMVAAGEADLYPRLGPTSEWDTAAAQAVVEAAGGHVVDNEMQSLRYNQTSSILNPDFFVMGDHPNLWRDVLNWNSDQPSI